VVISSLFLVQRVHIEAVDAKKSLVLDD